MPQDQPVGSLTPDQLGITDVGGQNPPWLPTPAPPPPRQVAAATAPQTDAAPDQQQPKPQQVAAAPATTPPPPATAPPTPLVPPEKPAPPAPTQPAPQREPLSRDSAADNSLGSVFNRVAWGEGKGQQFVLYGGQPYDPKTQPTLPGYYGFPDWPGKIGPDGQPTHAAGPVQWEPGTWKRAVETMIANGQADPAHPPNFNNLDDQKRVFGYWASKTYKDNGGGDLATDAAKGTVDYSKLASEWPSMAGHFTAGSLPSYQEWMKGREEQKRILRDEIADLQAQYDKADPDSKRSRELLDQLNQRRIQDLDLVRDMIHHPPQYTPRDMLSNFGSIATLIGIFGGLRSGAPLTASLGAAGDAMNAMNQQNYNQYKMAFDTWKEQVTMTETMLGQENQSYRDVLEDRRLTDAEKTQRLAEKAALWGNKMALAQLDAGDYPGFVDLVDKQQKALAELNKSKAQLIEADAKSEKAQAEAGLGEAQKSAVAADDRAFVQQYRAKNKGADPTPDQMAQAHYDNVAKRAAEMKAATRSTSGGLETSKTLEILDPQGHVVRTVLARERRDAPGWVDSQSGEPIHLDSGQSLKEVTPTTAGGGRAGMQTGRQLIGGREVLSDLQNVVRLPVGTTIGPLGTAVPGPSLQGALTGDLARKLTDQDSQLMQASMASMKRELSTLMSPVYGGNYASEQIDPLIPKSGQTIGTAIFQIARLAQSADNALEGVTKMPWLSNDEREFAEQMRQQIKEAIPWTPGQALDFIYRGHPKESFGDFVKRQNITGSTAASRPDWATGRSGTAMRNGQQAQIYETAPGSNIWLYGDKTPYQPQTGVQ
jgi:hypothetical protein